MKEVVKIPYDNVYSFNKKYLHYTIRFDCLQQDFDNALKMIGIKKKRDLPIYNKTAKIRKEDELPYNIVSKYFGPFYNENIEFFEKEFHNVYSRMLLFKILQPIRKLKWNYLDNRLKNADKNDSYFGKIPIKKFEDVSI